MSRVLVIDDSPMLVELTVRALGSVGYQATGATDLASLDQKLSEGPFALILMDVNMPEMFGDDVVEYLRTQKKVTSKLVLYSDIAEEELAAKTRNSGADAYILKGGGIEAVISGIMRILGAPTASATAPARPVAAPVSPAARAPTTTAAPRPPAVAPATRAPGAVAAPRPVAPGTAPQTNVAPPPRVAPATQAQAIPGPRAPVAGQPAQPRPAVHTPAAAGPHPAPVAAQPATAAPRAPVAGQPAQPRPAVQPPAAAGAHPATTGSHPTATAPRAPVATAQPAQPRPAVQPPVAATPATPTAPPAAAHAAPAVAPSPAPTPVAPQATAPTPTPAPAAPVTTPAPAPAAPAPAATGGFPSAAKMAAAAGRKPRILIVDDSEMTARIIEADLVSKGFEVHIADSADKATKIILKKQTRPDLVLLDVRMPNVNGEQFCRFIKSNSLFKGIKVLLCSGENVEELQRICREAGADGYVPKDAVLGHLVAKELNPSTGQE